MSAPEQTSEQTSGQTPGERRHDWESTFKKLAWIGFATIFIGLFVFGSVPVMLAGAALLFVFGTLGYGH